MASWGEPWLEAGVVPTRYRAEGFAQASFAQNEVLVSSVLEMVASVGSLQDKRLVEIYAGRGNLTLPLAREGAHVLALEVDTQAVADAKLAVEANELTGQVTFAPFHDERESLHDVCEQHQHWPDGVLVDPPARGLSTEVRTQLLALRPGWIAYVSCDAATLARDLRGLLDGGYELVSVAGVDLMPQTSHVEAIALVRLQSDK
jgi:23S rRNA (uracil1939-C5)-methyltransferase